MNNPVSAVIQKARSEGRKNLSEHESKTVLKAAGIPVTEEYVATSEDEAVKSAARTGYPAALKGLSHTLTHKTEMDIIRLNVKNEDELRKAYRDITSKGLELEGVLVQQMIQGNRELVMGMGRDMQFGPYVMFGLGGIFTEALNDVSFRIAPLRENDALEMIDEIKTQKILQEFRGTPPVDKKALSTALVSLGNLASRYDDIAEIDINPLIITRDRPVAVDALVVLQELSR